MQCPRGMASGHMFRLFWFTTGVSLISSLLDVSGRSSLLYLEFDALSDHTLARAPRIQSEAEGQRRRQWLDPCISQGRPLGMCPSVQAFVGVSVHE